MPTPLGESLTRATIKRELAVNRERRDELAEQQQENRDECIAIVRRGMSAGMSVRSLATLVGVKRERLHEWLRGQHVTVRLGRPPEDAA